MRKSAWRWRYDGIEMTLDDIAYRLGRSSGAIAGLFNRSFGQKPACSLELSDGNYNTHTIRRLDEGGNFPHHFDDMAIDDKELWVDDLVCLDACPSCGANMFIDGDMEYCPECEWKMLRGAAMCGDSKRFPYKYAGAYDIDKAQRHLDGALNSLRRLEDVNVDPGLDVYIDAVEYDINNALKSLQVAMLMSARRKRAHVPAGWEFNEYDGVWEKLYDGDLYGEVIDGYGFTLYESDGVDGEVLCSGGSPVAAEAMAECDRQLDIWLGNGGSWIGGKRVKRHARKAHAKQRMFS